MVGAGSNFDTVRSLRAALVGMTAKKTCPERSSPACPLLCGGKAGTRRGKAGQGGARRGKAGQGGARRDKAGQGGDKRRKGSQPVR